MRRTARANAGGTQGIPPTACTQYKQNRFHRRAVAHPWVMPPNGCGLRGGKSGDICAQISSGNRQPSSFFSKPMIDLLFMDFDLKITDEPYWDTLLKRLAPDSYSASNLATGSRRCWADAYERGVARPASKPGALTAQWHALVAK
jgi:hypothetical protein